MTDEAPSPRVAAVARLRRAASQREMRGGEAGQEAGQEKPRLQRTASERARDMAMAKLMGSGPAENAAGPNT